MRFFKKNVDGQWKTMEATPDVIKKILHKNIKYNYSLLVFLRTKYPQLSMEERLALFYRAAPSYGDMMNDEIERSIQENSVETNATTEATEPAG